MGGSWLSVGGQAASRVFAVGVVLLDGVEVKDEGSADEGGRESARGCELAYAADADAESEGGFGGAAWGTDLLGGHCPIG